MKKPLCCIVVILTLFTSHFTCSMKHHAEDAHILPDKRCKQMASTAAFLEAIRQGNVYAVEQCISQGIELNVQDSNGTTPLMLAVKEGYVRIVEKLLANQACVNVQDNQGNTPLFLALSKAGDKSDLDITGNFKRVRNVNYWVIAVKLIEAGAFLDSKTLQCKTTNSWEHNGTYKEPVMVHSYDYSSSDVSIVYSLCAAAARIGSVKCLQRLADMKTKDGGLLDALVHKSHKKSLGGAFFFACFDGQLETAQFLSKHGVNINIKNEEKETPLVCAAEQGNIKMVQWLIKAGANVNASGEAALKAAARSGHKDIAELLIRNGAEVCHIQGYVDSPLLCAIEGKNTALVKILLEAGARPFDVGEDRTAVELAIFYKAPEIVKLLIEHGAEVATDDIDNDINELLTDIVKNDLKHLASLIDESRELVNIVPETVDNYTPLMLASLLGNTSIVEALIAAGAEIQEEDKHGLSALGYAAAVGNESIAAMLIAQGSTVLSTALVQAIKQDHYDLAQKLIQKGAGTSNSCFYHAPLMAAVQAQKKDLVVSLIDAGADVTFLTKEDSLHLDIRACTNEDVCCIIGAARQPMFRQYLKAQSQLAFCLDAGSYNSNFLAQKQTPLMWACMLGHKGVVEGILAAGKAFDFNEQDAFGRTALMYAIICGHTALVDLVLQHKNNCTIFLDTRDVHNNTALYYAIETNNLKIVKALLSAGAKVTTKSLRLAANKDNKDILINLVLKAYKTYGALFGVDHRDAQRLLPLLF